MNNMQSKQEGSESSESIYWFLKTLREEREKQAQQTVISENPDEAQEINMLRFINLLSPPVEKLIEISKNELNIPLLKTTSILEELKKKGEIDFEMISKPTGDVNVPTFEEKIVKITPIGLTRLEGGG